ncbi:MAG: tRNA threonylcarbamoyladenosine dehydratase [Clostridia bacterium]|nr:tRNA threonylcarbamoyladenosine dehydratase [Clostridia bacterium]
MDALLERTARLVGEEKARRLKNKRVAIFGVGGVGGYIAEALARAGIGAIDLIDHDTVSPTNLNRQLIALHSTIGQLKVAVMRDRILDINPDCQVNAYPLFYLPENADTFDLSQYDYVADAIDTVSAKLALIEGCHKANTPIISAMGAGNKMDPCGFIVCDIQKTSVCPLARVMRRELRKRGIDHVKVVYSQEEALTPSGDKRTPGSVPFVPGAAGLAMAGAILKELWG